MEQSKLNKEERIFKILAIDGGGIRGIYSAKILEKFENKFECQIADYFDMLCGTSTGGLIALGLSLKIPAERIVKLYREDGKKIFKQQNKYAAFLKQIFWGGRHSDIGLHNSLKEIFTNEETKEPFLIGESNCLLCIPSFSLTDGRPFVFKYDHKEGGLSRDNLTPYIDVAKATSAAPTYLPIAQIDIYNKRQFVDGGVCANNPSLVGIAEALKYFVGSGKEFNKLMVMSIASLESINGRRLYKNRNRSLIEWGDDLFSTFFDGQAHMTSYFVETLSEYNNPSFKYLRIPSLTIPPEQTEIITLDNATEEALHLMEGKGFDQGLIYEKRSDVAEFFKNRKQYNIRE
jgi:uncharacterized protein